MSTLSAPLIPTGSLIRLRWMMSDTLTVVRRNLSHIRRVPEKLMDVTLQPIVFVLLFGYVFGSAIVLPGGGNYREYLMPGIFAMTMFGTVGGTATGVADDMARGLVDRFRSLPMARSAVLLGRTVADLLEAVLGLWVLIACGLLTGWHIHHGLGTALEAFGLLLLLGFAMNWVGVYVGLLVRSPEVAQTLVFTAFFPITFLANTFVPTGGMPAPLRLIADWNPLSAIVAACRGLFGNPGAAHPGAVWPLQHPIAASIGWSLLLLAVFVPLAVHRYRTATS